MSLYKPRLFYSSKDRSAANASPSLRPCPKDTTFGDSLGMAMTAATGAGAFTMDPLISSAAVAGASMTCLLYTSDAADE